MPISEDQLVIGQELTIKHKKSYPNQTGAVFDEWTKTTVVVENKNDIGYVLHDKEFSQQTPSEKDVDYEGRKLVYIPEQDLLVAQENPQNEIADEVKLVN